MAPAWASFSTSVSTHLPMQCVFSSAKWFVSKGQRLCECPGMLLLVCFSVVVIKLSGQRQPGRKGFIRFKFPDHIPSLRKVRAGAQARSLDAGTMAECCLLACPLVHSPPAFSCPRTTSRGMVQCVSPTLFISEHSRTLSSNTPTGQSGQGNPSFEVHSLQMTLCSSRQ